ncbi:MAG: VOC family protein [Opitutaceae bacterium]|nr:VOC family protein [Opitutaceae bacterium]
MIPTSIRSGFPTASPYLIYKDASAALAFYAKAFGAETITRFADDNGLVVHAEFRIGDSTFMMTSENPTYAWMKSVETLGDSPVQLFLYVDDVDARFQRALDAGATVVMPLAEQPYGRSGGVKDPFGLVWWLSTHKEMPA